MAGGFKKIHHGIHVGKAEAHHAKGETLAKRSTCSGSTFYTAPTSGQSVDSNKEVTFSWDTKCLSPAPQYVDIYLYAPQMNSSMIQAFDSATYSDGKLQTALDPNWWGSNATVQLQLQIVQHGETQFMSDVPAGPIWTATYNSNEPGAPKASTGSPSVAQRVKNILHAIPGGSVAAAVIFPLLFVVILVFFYVRRQRKRTAEKTNRFSTAIDQRMSTINPDWNSISGAGANAAIRNSMAVRSSVFGGDRPSSIAGNHAGIGALRTSEEKVPQMEEMANARRSVFTNGERVSRISFAPDTRSSYYEKENPRLPSAVRGLNSRSFHQAQTYNEEEERNHDLIMSPTQAAGPALLHPHDIAARASSDADTAFQREVLKMPAMTLMRTGGAADTEFVLPHTTVTPPANAQMPAMPPPALQPNTSMGGASATPAALSPDALLRAYAAGRPLASPSPGPTAGLNNGGMRVLYQNDSTPTISPQYPTLGDASSANLAPGSADNNPFRKSMADNQAVRATMYTESMYSANAYDDDAAYDTHHAHDDHAARAYGHAQ